MLVKKIGKRFLQRTRRIKSRSTPRSRRRRMKRRKITMITP
jgi:hypothetical protein